MLPSLELAAATAIDRVRGRYEPGLPPLRVRNIVGPGDFAAIGAEFVGHLRELADLAPTDRVLDVGSGAGRMALPLTEYLEEGGSYDGLEIVGVAVHWCRRHISRLHPNFSFHHADVRNGMYNPRGKSEPELYRFPFDDDSFDVAFLTSVFTHLMPDSLERYVSELRRVLAPGGRVLATFFLLAQDAPPAEAAEFNFVPLGETGVMTTDLEVPEEALAYPEQRIRALVCEHGFTLREPIHFGSWSGRANARSFQDIVVLVAEG